MSRQIRVTLLVFAIVVAVATVGYTRSWFAGDGDRLPPRSGQDLSNHPIYSLYDFGKGDRVIDVGIQPLWVPTNLIAEAMRRDAILSGGLSDLGLEIRFHAFFKGADVNFFLSRGDLEVGVGGDMPALTAAAKDNVVVAALIQQGFCAIVARKHMLIDDLRGKRIAYAFGSNAHYALLNTLSRAGLGETDVDLVQFDVNEMPDALNEGKIDAFSAWEPTPFLAKTRYQGQVIIHRSLSTGYLYYSRSFFDRHPEAARAILAAELRAVSWMRLERNLRRVAEWAQTAEGNLTDRPPSLSVRDYVMLAQDDLLGTASLVAIPEAYLTADGPLMKEFEFLKSLGMIPETAEWVQVRSCFDRSLTSEVLGASRQHQLRTYEYPDDRGEEP